MILPYNRIGDELLKECGGKGASLVRLARANLPVPEGCILTAGSSPEEADSIIENLSDRYTYAVRSSALNEDGEKASFAGAYETITDVAREDIPKAVRQVISSADSERVKLYSEVSDVKREGIAVVIQRFVKPEFAGVVFTSDIITGSAAHMVGNYVKGEGELLVSGSSDAEEFRFDAIRYDYEGKEEFAKYARSLYICCVKIRDLWNKPMDIEWAVSDGKLYILQARPITTLSEGSREEYTINGSMSGEYLLTRTNVGEIFMRPLSPVTFSLMDKISNSLGMPKFVDNIYGQAYLNVSVVCSALVSLGLKRSKAQELIKDITGAMPEGTEVPVFPMDKNKFLSNLFSLIRPKRKKTKLGINDSALLRDEISKITTKEELADYWDNSITPYINNSLSEIMKGVNISGLFTVKKKVAELCGEELGDRLLTGSVGILDSMKPLLMLDDLAQGKIGRNEYINACGHRHANEMELACPYPYEDPAFPENLVEEHKKAAIDVASMKKSQEQAYEDAKEGFLKQNPSKRAKLERLLAKYAKANRDRESVRSEGVKIFCVIREFLIKAGDITGIGDDIFMLYIDEVISLLKGDDNIRDLIGPRRTNYNKYLSYPQFPNLLIGRFDPEQWMADPVARKDIFIAGEGSTEEEGANVIRGFAGAAGKVKGKVRVLTDISQKDEFLPGEILVTNATNIGWTVIFPQVSAIVTDIGAPLSHAAIVAREFGIPAVVGCSNATTLLKTGDTVTVDGTSGTVTIEDV